MNNKKIITVKEAADMLGVTPLTLRNWDKRGKLKALRHPMNNYRVYSRESIEKLLLDMNNGEKPLYVPRRKRSKKLEIKHIRD